MSSSGFQITTAGLSAASIATSGGPYINITQFKVGDGYGYTPNVAGTETALHGSILYTGVPTSFTISDDGAIEVLLLMDPTVGPFSFGEIGLYLADGSLFASCAFSALQDKVRAVGNQAGSTWVIRAHILLRQTPANVTVTVTNTAALLEVANWEGLVAPISQPATVNAAIVHVDNSSGDSVLVARNSDYDWAIVGYINRLTGSVSDGGASSTTTSITHPNIASLLLTMPSSNSRYVAKFSSGLIRQITNQSGSTITFGAALGAAPTGVFSLWEDTASYAVTAASSAFTTSDVKLTLKTSADPGFVMCNDGTIGDASSAASTRANVDCQALFLLLWTNCNDTNAPVVTGRGASALADWNAHKKITLTRMLGRALAISGSGSGLTTRTLGQYLGTETHQLTVGELAIHNHTTTESNHTHSVSDPTHAHSVYDPGHLHGLRQNFTQNGNDGGHLTGGYPYSYAPNYYPGPVTDAAGTGIGIYGAATGISISANSTGLSINNAGSNTAHNTMQPTTFLNAMIKL